MHSILRSVGILLILTGIGSFIMPKFNRDHKIWIALGSSRNPVMILTVLVGSGITVLSYMLQGSHELNQATRRRTARQEPEYEEDSPKNYADSEINRTAAATAIAELERSEIEQSSPIELERREIQIAAPEMEPARGGSAVVVAVQDAPQVVAEYSPVAEEKAGSESVVIEKRDEDAAKHLTEKSPSSIVRPSEKRFRASPAFEEDPESIFDELPQSPPTSLK